MTLRLDARTTGLAALLLTVVTAAALHRLSPPPLADTKRGSEQAFARGLEAREIENGVLARRWAGARLGLVFVNLPEGPLDVELEVRSQRHPVVVTQGGAVLGTLPPGSGSARYRLTANRGGKLELELTAETFVARGGRQLGFLFERAAVRPSPPGLWPPLALLVWLLLPCAAALAGARTLGLAPPLTLGLVALVLVVLTALLLPHGLVRSTYVRELSAWLALGLIGSALLARLWAGGLREAGPGEDSPAAGRWGFAALLSAFLVQGVVPAHPCLVASDAVFHAHNLQAVANGDFGLTSLTPHDPPFQFPYGVSFYFLLVPLLHTGFDLTTLVRFLASLSAIAASASLFAWLAPAGAKRAASTVGLLQLMPAVFDPFSAGNYSNVFAQSISLLFLAWWAGRAPGGPILGALLLAVAAIAHFGGLLFLVSLCGLLLLATGRGVDRPRGLALGVGLVLTAGYYSQFLGLVLSQVARALDGAASGGTSLFAGLAAQAGRAISEWGPPLVGLAILGIASRGKAFYAGPHGPRGMAVLGLAGLPFLAAAAASPLEVRYLYAVAPVIALLGADGLLAAAAPGRASGLRRGLGIAAVLAQAALFLDGVGRALFERYRA